MTTQLTQDEWYTKLKGFVPRWFWQEEQKNKALLMAIAKALGEVQGAVDDHISDTFILTSHDGTLDTHARERSLTRLVGQIHELDAQFAKRVQSLVNQSNVPALKKLIDNFLIAGECTITEDFSAQIFLDREFFVNRGAISFDPLIINTFSVIVDKQIHTPYSFADREYFCDRENFVGGSESGDYLFEVLKRVIDDNKALGTLYRIIERLE